MVSTDKTSVRTTESPLQCQRSQFDIPDEITWLDAAYLSPLSRATIAAGFRGVERRAKPWDLPSSEFFREVEAARMEFARLIRATAEDVAIVPAVSYGIAVAARNLSVRKGDRIVVLADQFPSNFYGWQDLCDATGAELIRVPWAHDYDWAAGISSAEVA